MTDRFPNKVKLTMEKPFYTGSVQKLYAVDQHPEFLISETTVGGSVFDVGTIFSIEGSDIGRASFRHLVFQELQNPGTWKSIAKLLDSKDSILQHDDTGLFKKVLSEFSASGALTHHVGMIDRENGDVYTRGYPPHPSNLTLIKKYEVIKPRLTEIFGSHFYDYAKYHDKSRYVIPLEYIVRLGIASGSSVLRKYNRLSTADRREYLAELRIDKPLTPWMQFTFPLVDLTTKYEPEDRNISRQEAALISGLDGETFSRSLMIVILGAYLLKEIFARIGLCLWDMKWEIARDVNRLVFVDTIDTDSVRVTVNLTFDNKSCFVHFNKQAMRDYYKIMHADWYAAVNDAKKIAAQTGSPFTEILSEGQKENRYPGNPKVDPHFLDIQKDKFSMIQSFIQNRGQDMRNEAERIARAEIDYYVSSKKKEQYEELNAVPLA